MSDEALRLLDEAAEHMGDAETAPNGTWWKRYFLLTGSHMILTDEGWESGSGKAEYAKQAEEDGVPLSDFIHDEVGQ